MSTEALGQYSSTKVTLSTIGGSLKVSETTMPKFPPPAPRQAQNKSLWQVSLAVITLPL